MCFCELCYFEIKTGKINKDQQGWIFLYNVALYGPQRFLNVFQFSKDFTHACDGDVAVVIDNTNAGFLKPFAAHTTEFNRQRFAQSLHKMVCMIFPGKFTCYDNYF